MSGPARVVLRGGGPRRPGPVSENAGAFCPGSMAGMADLDQGRRRGSCSPPLRLGCAAGMRCCDLSRCRRGVSTVSDRRQRPRTARRPGGRRDRADDRRAGSPAARGARSSTASARSARDAEEQAARRLRVEERPRRRDAPRRRRRCGCRGARACSARGTCCGCRARAATPTPGRSGRAREVEHRGGLARAQHLARGARRGRSP